MIRILQKISRVADLTYINLAMAAVQLDYMSGLAIDVYACYVVVSIRPFEALLEAKLL
jgi:hypothetical protein